MLMPLIYGTCKSSFVPLSGLFTMREREKCNLVMHFMPNRKVLIGVIIVNLVTTLSR